MYSELSPLIVQVALLIVYIYSEFQVYIMYSTGRDMSKSLHDDNNNDNAEAKAVAIPRVFSEIC